MKNINKTPSNLIGISGKAQSGKDLIGKIIQYLTAEASEAGKAMGMHCSIKEYLSTNNSSDYTDIFKIKKFATKIKEILCHLTGCTMKNLENEEFKNSYMTKEWDKKIDITGNSYDRITYRQALQLIGTDLFRDKFHPDIWVNILFAKYTLCEGMYCGCQKCANEKDPTKFKDRHYPNWLITDLRFLNEAQAIIDRGGILINVVRNQEKAALNITKNTLKHKSEIDLDNHFIFNYVINNNGSIKELIKKVRTILIKEGLI